MIITLLYSLGPSWCAMIVGSMDCKERSTWRSTIWAAQAARLQTHRRHRVNRPLERPKRKRKAYAGRLNHIPKPERISWTNPKGLKKSWDSSQNRKIHEQIPNAQKENKKHTNLQPPSDTPPNCWNSGPAFVSLPKHPRKLLRCERSVAAAGCSWHISGHFLEAQTGLRERPAS